MQLITFLIALSSISFFEGGRRLLAPATRRSGCVLASCGLVALLLAAWLHISEDKAYRVMSPPEGGVLFNARVPWLVPKEALPGLPMAEQAEKTRILAVGYYTSTGNLIEHLSAEGRSIRLAPTQEEIKVREELLAWQVSSNAHLSHTYEKPIHLFVVVLVAVLAIWAFRQRPVQSAS